MGFAGSWAGAGRQSCIDSPHPPVRSGLGWGPQLSSRPEPIRTLQSQIDSPVCSLLCGWQVEEGGRGTREARIVAEAWEGENELGRPVRGSALAMQRGLEQRPGETDAGKSFRGSEGSLCGRVGLTPPGGSARAPPITIMSFPQTDPAQRRHPWKAAHAHPEPAPSGTNRGQTLDTEMPWTGCRPGNRPPAPRRKAALASVLTRPLAHSVTLGKSFYSGGGERGSWR